MTLVTGVVTLAARLGADSAIINAAKNSFIIGSARLLNGLLSPKFIFRIDDIRIIRSPEYLRGGMRGGRYLTINIEGNRINTMSYETLDAIADSYIPILLFLFIASFLSKLYKLWPCWKPLTIHIAFLIGLAVIAYGLMFLDSALGIWPHFGLDYSTHTAVSLVLVFLLCALMPASRIRLIISFVAYVLLMLYQKYHSAADIFTTALIVSACSLGLFIFLKSRLPTSG